MGKYGGRRSSSRAMDVDAVGPSLAGLPSLPNPRTTTRRQGLTAPNPSRGRGAQGRRAPPPSNANSRRARRADPLYGNHAGSVNPHNVVRRIESGDSLSSRFGNLYAASPSPSNQPVLRGRRQARRPIIPKTKSNQSNLTRGADDNDGHRRGGRRQGVINKRQPRRKLDAESLDKDLESYMLRDKATGQAVLDAELDSYMSSKQAQ